MRPHFAMMRAVPFIGAGSASVTMYDEQGAECTGLHLKE
jgi:hypothetical protein